jgi:flagellin glycosyltransferase Maf-like protein/6-hydroxymethylpterin diphosphokinase MptE-like protein
MTSGDRAARSRAAFIERFPEIATAIDQQASQSSITRDGDEPDDIVIGDRHLYGGTARAKTTEQVAAFMKKPLRLIMETPQAAGLVSPICVGLQGALQATLERSGTQEIARGPISAPTFLVVFGVGLGHHLRELVRATKVRWVIIVEPFVEFIGHSFEAVDWHGMFEEVEAGGGSVEVVTGLDPGRIVGSVMQAIMRCGTSYLDGTWVYTHYPIWAFSEAAKRMHGAASFAYINRGFFEDELLMMTNAVTNFCSRAFWLLDSKPRLHRRETAVVVGAGPSLDEAIETLHRIRDKVVLFSAGTALRPLLRHGLVPDFHCELENGQQVVEVIDEVRHHGDLSSVCLIASSTVDPRVPAMFGDCVLFFRDSVSSTRILRGDRIPLSGAAPTCVNTAVSAAAHLGFTDFLLFGTDCGTRPGMHDHAAGTIYRDLDKWRTHAAQRERYPLELEGNFGGIAFTNWVYDASRRLLMDLIAAYRLNVVNCSDGALISGATPRVPESVEIDGPPIDHRAVIAEVKRSMSHFGPRELLSAGELAGLRERSNALFGDVRDILAGFDVGGADFAGVYDAIRKFLDEAGATYGHVNAIVDGSLSALPRIAMFYGCRTEGDRRRRLFSTFLAEFAKALTTMELGTNELFRRLTQLLAEETATVTSG